MSSIVTIRVDEKVREQLDDLARATRRSRSFLAAEALREYIELQEWQIREIKNGIREADAKQVKSHQKVMKKLDEKLARLVDRRRGSKSA